MEHITASIEIDRPVAEVFAFVADVRNMAAWQSQVIETTRADEPAVGATFEQRVQTPMRDVDSTGAITELEQDRRFAISTAGGPLKTQAAFDFTEAGGITTIIMEMTLDATKAFKIALPVVARAVKKNAPENLVALKSLLESGAGESSPGHDDT